MDVNERERLQFDTSKATMLLNGRYLVEFYCSRNRKKHIFNNRIQQVIAKPFNSCLKR